MHETTISRNLLNERVQPAQALKSRLQWIPSPYPRGRIPALLNFGVTHKRAPLATLDSVTFRDPVRFYQISKALPEVKGSLLLQTCNRVEIYLDTDSGDVARVLYHWALETRFKLRELNRLVEVRRDREVVDHLVRLGAGLESMIIGETQILGQIKSALSTARSNGAANPLLCDLVDKATAAAAKIREQTGIGKGVVSVGSVAVRLAEETLGIPETWRVLVIGTGQVAMLTVKALKARGLASFHISGRSKQRIESFCGAYGGTPLSLQEARSRLSSFNLLVVATTATSYLITRQMVAPSPGLRLVIMDLSNPRNVSPAVQEIPGVTLMTIDSLRGIAKESLARRKTVVERAEPLIEEKVETIVSLTRRRTAEPIVSEIFRRAAAIRTKELEKALSKLKLTHEQEEVLETMTQSIVEKLLALPAIQLRKAAEKGDSELLLAGGQIFRGE